MKKLFLLGVILTILFVPVSASAVSLEGSWTRTEASELAGATIWDSQILIDASGDGYATASYYSDNRNRLLLARIQNNQITEYLRTDLIDINAKLLNCNDEGIRLVWVHFVGNTATVRTSLLNPDLSFESIQNIYAQNSEVSFSISKAQCEDSRIVISGFKSIYTSLDGGTWNYDLQILDFDISSKQTTSTILSSEYAAEDIVVLGNTIAFTFWKSDTCVFTNNALFCDYYGNTITSGLLGTERLIATQVKVNDAPVSSVEVDEDSAYFSWSLGAATFNKGLNNWTSEPNPGFKVFQLISIGNGNLMAFGSNNSFTETTTKTRIDGSWSSKVHNSLANRGSYPQAELMNNVVFVGWYETTPQSRGILKYRLYDIETNTWGTVSTVTPEGLSAQRDFTTRSSNSNGKFVSLVIDQDSSRQNSFVLYSFQQALAPSSPTDVTASGINGGASVSWTAPTNNGGSEITQYKIYWTTGSKICSSSPCNVTGLQNGVSYTFSVTAFNANGESVPSEISNSVLIGVAPDKPSITNIEPLNAGAKVYFNAVDGNGSAIDFYSVHINPGEMQTGCNSSPCIVGGLQNGITYTIQISAISSVGESEYSDPVLVTPQIGEPILTAVTNIRWELISKGKYKFSWSGGSVSNGKFSGYSFRIKDVSKPKWSKWSPVAKPNRASINGLIKGHKYNLSIRIHSGNYSKSNTFTVKLTK